MRCRQTRVRTTPSLLDTEIALNGDDSMESVAERAIKNGGYDFTVSEYGYISSVNGLAEYAYQGSGGWMATLNDWFTADGTASYTVENGGLQAGDDTCCTVLETTATTAPTTWGWCC